MSDKAKEQLEHLSQIRSLMEESTQFLSLSGLSGVFAGVFALIGGWLARFDYFTVVAPMEQWMIQGRTDAAAAMGESYIIARIKVLLLIGVCVLAASLAVGLILTASKAKKQNKQLVTKASIKMFINLLIPLAAGGIFCLSLIYNGYFGAVAPATLIFYGLALINGSKYTYRDIRYLGILEIALGLVSSFYIGYGLWFWMIGFGVLHIVYGLAMYLKYDRNNK